MKIRLEECTSTRWQVVTVFTSVKVMELFRDDILGWAETGVVCL